MEFGCELASIHKVSTFENPFSHPSLWVYWNIVDNHPLCRATSTLHASLVETFEISRRRQSLSLPFFVYVLPELKSIP